MNLVELDRALRQLRLSGMAAVLETRLRHAQTEKLTPIDLISTLVSDELLRRQDRLLERRHKQARFHTLRRTNRGSPFRLAEQEYVISVDSKIDFWTTGHQRVWMGRRRHSQT